MVQTKDSVEFAPLPASTFKILPTDTRDPNYKEAILERANDVAAYMKQTLLGDTIINSNDLFARLAIGDKEAGGRTFFQRTGILRDHRGYFNPYWFNLTLLENERYSIDFTPDVRDHILLFQRFIPKETGDKSGCPALVPRKVLERIAPVSPSKIYTNVIKGSVIWFVETVAAENFPL